MTPTTVTGTITFTVNVAGSQEIWETVPLSTTGSATAYDGFGDLPAGSYLLTADYSGSGAYAATSASLALTVQGPGSGGGSTGTIYSYSITGANGSSGYMLNSNIQNYTDSVTRTWNISGGYDRMNRLVAATHTPAGGNAEYSCWALDSFGNRRLRRRFFSRCWVEPNS